MALSTFMEFKYINVAVLDIALLGWLLGNYLLGRKGWAYQRSFYVHILCVPTLS